MESRTIRYGVTAVIALLLAFGVSACSKEPGPPGPAHDPGVRNDGAAGAGNSYPGLPDPWRKLFVAGQAEFVKTDQVVDDGLGPQMNLNSCGGCHAQPAIGGSSPQPNPQFVFFNTKDGVNKDTNKLPSFITENGPTREARFKKNRYAADPETATDGGVHDLFTIDGMKGAEGCKLEQPEFEEELSHKNVIFRIPTPVFGAGLIEQIPDTAIMANITKEAGRKKDYGIESKLNIVMSGNTRTAQPNRNGNDGTIARFGWKAQNKSLLLFSGEAYNVEMGISNELFQTERAEKESCQLKATGTPNDFTNPSNDGLEVLSDIEKFASFMRLLAPPERSNNVKGASAASIANGETLFSQVGCALCHTPMLKTGKFKIPFNNQQFDQLSEKEVHLWSDLALHHMGSKLNDGVSQGQAKGDEFRTAPLWGLGERIFFLHDGRKQDLVEAIEEHRSGPDADTKEPSEANAVVEQYDKLSEKDKQDLLNFLRSL